MFGTIRALAKDLEDGRVFGLPALLEAGKGKSLSCGIESIGTRRKVAIGNQGPAVAVEAAFDEIGAGEFLIPGIVVDQRDGSVVAGKFVVVQLIVFGIEEMTPGIGGMKLADLFLQRDELILFLGIAGNCPAGDRKLYSELGFDRGRDDGVIGAQKECPAKNARV